MTFTKKSIINIIRYLLGLSLVALLISRLNVRDLSVLLSLNNLLYTVTGTTLIILALSLFEALRMHLLIADHSNGFKNTFRLSLVSTFLGTYLPGTAGAEVFKIYYLKRDAKIRWDQSVLLIAADRITGVIVLFFFGVFYAVAYFAVVNKVFLFLLEKVTVSYPNIGTILEILLLVVTIIFIIVLVKFKTQLKKYTKSMLEGFILIAQKKEFLLLIGLIVLFHLLRAVGISCFLRCFNVQVSMQDIIFCLVITAFISLIPISIAALGVREGILTLLLMAFNVPEGSALTSTFALRACSIIVALWGGWLYLSKKNSFRFV